MPSSTEATIKTKNAIRKIAETAPCRFPVQTGSANAAWSSSSVKVAVFLTFALSALMRPKRMGIILGFVALRDALLVRLMLVPILLRL